MLSIEVDFSGFFKKLDIMNDVVYDEAVTFVEQAADVGVEATRFALDAATTPYGEKRFAAGRGGSAGRNDTGNMINSVEAISAYIDTDGVSIEFGWQDPEDYFYAQELGSNRIAPAMSLLDGRDAVEAEMGRLASNMKQRIRRKLR